ncbi:MAG: NAD-dependent epimerase/dehydratase family protein [Candidatus Latescibacteria bacterium]|nr:NAD-dependent epimerase/dehydratase family protein [Candidatus Latescibacterota bacterium]
MNVFITGATGYIGSAVVTALVRAGHEVSGLVRSEAKARLVEQQGAKAVVGDIKQPETYRDIAGRHDAVIHTAFDMSGETVAADRATVETLIKAAQTAGGRKTIIFTSGVWVLGSTGGRTMDETAAVNPIPPVVWRPEHERLMLSAATADLATVVIRPGVVYGGSRGILAGYFKAASEGQPIRIVGDGTNHWAMVHVDDLADLYRRAVERRLTGVFHGTDGSALTVREIVETIARSAGRSSAVETWPVDSARQTLGGFADGLAIDQVVLSAASERELGWLPRFRSFVRRGEELWREWSQQR